MNIPALIRNCFIGVLIWAAILFGAVSMAGADHFNPGQTVGINFWCTSATKMTMLIKGQKIEEGCFEATRPTFCAFKGYHGYVTDDKGRTYRMASCVTFPNYQTVYSAETIEEKTS